MIRLNLLMKKCSKKNSYFLSAAILLTLFRLYLYYKASYSIDTTADYDDQLMIRYTKNILKGDWLGAYNTTTLSKGISYSLFLALTNKLHLSYSLLFGMFNVIACGLLAFSFKPIAKKWTFFFIYLFFLFSPISFTHEYSTRIYRNAIVIPSVQIIIASLLSIYFGKFDLWKKNFFWFLLFSLIFPFYWFTREDSIWLLPFILTALGITFVQIILGPEFSLKNKKRIEWLHFSKKKVAALSLFFLPLLTFFFVSQMIKHKNEITYGVAIINDRTQGEFGTLMRHLIRIDDGTTLNINDSRIWVSHEALNQALKASSTFSKVSDNIQELYTTHPWTKAGKDKELKGDIIFWALRDVVSESGYYKDAKETDKFWKKVNQELSRAFDEGKLKKKKEVYLIGTGDGKVTTDFPILLKFLSTSYKYNFLYRNFQQGNNYSYGTYEEVKQVEKLLRIPLLNRWTKVNSETFQSSNFPKSKITKIATAFIKIYQWTAIPVLIIAYVGLLFLITGMIYAKKERNYYFSSFLILMGLLATQFLFLFGVSWFCSYSPEQKDYFLSVYIGAGIPIMQSAIVIIFLGFAKINYVKLKHSVKYNKKGL